MVMEHPLMLMVARYVSAWKNCKKNGHGTYTYAHGRSYVGEYKNDDRHGHGTYSDADGIELCCYANSLSLFHVHAIILLLLVLLLLLLYCILLIFYSIINYRLSIVLLAIISIIHYSIFSIYLNINYLLLYYIEGTLVLLNMCEFIYITLHFIKITCMFKSCDATIIQNHKILQIFTHLSDSEHVSTCPSPAKTKKTARSKVLARLI